MTEDTIEIEPVKAEVAVMPNVTNTCRTLACKVRLALAHAAYHLLRAPWYWLKLIGLSPVGLFRALRGLTRWVFDTAHRDAYLAAMTKENTDATRYLALREHRAAQLRNRSIGALILLGLTALIVVLAVKADAPQGWKWLALAVSLGVLGWFGRIERVTIATQAEPVLKGITSQLILDAVLALGIAGITRAIKEAGNEDAPGKSVRVGIPAKGKHGTHVTVELPGSVSAKELCTTANRERLASALRMPSERVWPSVDDKHAGVLRLFVADKRMRDMKIGQWPLLHSGAVNFFADIPFGVDTNGAEVGVNVVRKSCVFGANPRMGKTFSVRLIGLGASLDPTVEIRYADLKGTGDFDCFEPIATSGFVGSAPEVLKGLRDDLTAMVKDCERRAEVIRRNRHLMPESQITPEAAADKSLGLHPVLYIIDETQIAFQDRKYGKDITEKAEDLGKRGPALGITVIMATQKPTGDSIPTAVRDVASLRFCLMVKTQPANDATLGEGAYKGGADATTLDFEDKGIGYLDAEGPIRVVKTFYVDAVQASAVVERARKVREDSGWLTVHKRAGLHAVSAEMEGDDSGKPDVTVLRDLLRIWPTGEHEWARDKVWSDVLAARLVDEFGIRYRNLSARDLGVMVRSAGGPETVPIRRDGQQRRGFSLEAIADALDGLEDASQA